MCDRDGRKKWGGRPTYDFIREMDERQIDDSRQRRKLRNQGTGFLHEQVSAGKGKVVWKEETTATKRSGRELSLQGGL